MQDIISHEKYCPQCDDTKDRSEFPKSKANKDGLYGYCKSCHAARVKRYAAGYRAPPHVPVKYPDRICAECSGVFTSRSKAAKYCSTRCAGLVGARRRAADRSAVMPTSKVCTDCSRDLPLASFAKNKRGTFGLNGRCRECSRIHGRKQYHRHPEENQAKTRAWKAANRGKIRVKRLWWKYKMTEEEYAALLEKQGGRCALCGKTGKLCVDHDHKTGIVRGILCHRCNVGLGALGDDLEGVLSALAYLEAGYTYAPASSTDHPSL